MTRRTRGAPATAGRGVGVDPNLLVLCEGLLLSVRQRRCRRGSHRHLFLGFQLEGSVILHIRIGPAPAGGEPRVGGQIGEPRAFDAGGAGREKFHPGLPGRQAKADGL